MKLFRQEAIRKKASKAFRKKVSFPKVYQTLKKKAFLWFKKEKVFCEKAYYTLKCIEK